MLADLEIAILKDDHEGAAGYLAEIDRRTAGTAYKKAGEQFGFKTVEIHGVTYAHMGETAHILGYHDVSGIRKLMETYQIFIPKIGWFGAQGHLKIRAAFGLSEKDNHATLLPWEGFLVVGMYGRNPAAEKVKAYLLEKEREARIALETSTKEAVNAELVKIKRLDAVARAAGMAAKLEGSQYHALLMKEIASITGAAPENPRQTRLRLVTEETAK